MNWARHKGEASALVAQVPPAGTVDVAWLGQAGFLFRSAGCFVAVDPYLSDSLAIKYKGREFAHTRMMPIPAAPETLRPLDAVLCTHRHTDHMDPGTLPALAAANPACVFVVPASELAHARDTVGLPADRLRPVNAGDTVQLEALTIHVLPSAHECLEQDDDGNHRYLGYILDFGALRCYHSGDCVPYDGLAETMLRLDVHVAFLPVNGRDAYRSERGAPGNMTLTEAMDLCVAASIPHLVPHHFGMFAFNTLDEAELREGVANAPSSLEVWIPSANECLRMQTPLVAGAIPKEESLS